MRYTTDIGLVTALVKCYPVPGEPDDVKYVVRTIDYTLSPQERKRAGRNKAGLLQRVFQAIERLSRDEPYPEVAKEIRAYGRKMLVSCMESRPTAGWWLRAWGAKRRTGRYQGWELPSVEYLAARIAEKWYEPGHAIGKARAEADARAKEQNHECA